MRMRSRACGRLRRRARRGARGTRSTTGRRRSSATASCARSRTRARSMPRPPGVRGQAPALRLDPGLPARRAGDGAAASAPSPRSSRTTATASTSSTGAGPTPPQRAGLDYYPKLVIAAPATPGDRPRILLAPDAGAAAPSIRAALIAARARDRRRHRVLVDPLAVLHRRRAGRARRARLLPARELQFHWQNRGYATFDDFLGALK